MQETWVPSLGWEDPLEEVMVTQYSCLENLHGQKSLVGYSAWGCKESDTAQHSKVLASSSTSQPHFSARNATNFSNEGVLSTKSSNDTTWRSWN